MEDNLKEACTQRRYLITKQDLPLSCPMLDMRVWDAHPRVYLALDKEGRAVCPYCSAEFILNAK